MSRDEWHNRIHSYLLIALAGILPFAMHQSVRFTGLTVILIGVNALFSLRWLKRANWTFGLIPFSMVSLFLISGLGYFYSENLGSAGQLLESRLLILVMGLAFMLFEVPAKALVQRILQALTFGLLLSTIFIFKNGIVPFVDPAIHKGCLSCVMELLAPMHRPYYGFLIVVVIGYLITCILKDYKNWRTLVYFFAIVYLSAILYLVMPKMVLISAFIGGLILCFGYIIFGLKGLVRYLVLGIGTLFLLVSVWFFNGTRSIETKSNGTFQSSAESRELLWEASINLLKEPNTMLFGLGLGDESDALLMEMQVSRPEIAHQRLNAHNQYLAEWLKFGLAGLVLIIVIGISPLYFAWRNKDVLAGFVALLWMLNLLTENYLNRETGLLIWVLLVFPLAMRKPEKEKLAQKLAN